MLTLVLGTVLAFSTADCGVVSDVATRSENARSRRQRIRFVRNVDGVVEIVYAGPPMRMPIDAEAIGVRVAPAPTPTQAAEGEASLLVFSDDGTDAACPPFLVRVDDSFNDHVVVLAILEDGALLARGEGLFFARKPATEQWPMFRLAWQSSFTLRSASRPVTTPQPTRRTKKRR